MPMLTDHAANWKKLETKYKMWLEGGSEHIWCADMPGRRISLSFVEVV